MNQACGMQAANVAMSKAPAAAAKGKGRARKVKARRKKNQTAKKESALLAEHTGAESDDDEDYRQASNFEPESFVSMASVAHIGHSGKF